MTGTITFAPLVAWPLLLAATAITVVLVALVAWRGGRGWPLRGLAFAALLAALANPKLVAEDRKPHPDVALIVVDTSLSQSIGERSRQAAEAETAVRDALADLSDIELRSVRAGQRGDSETRLFEALDRTLVDLPRDRLAGVVFITDGQVHDLPTPGSLPDGVPLHALLTGSRIEYDRQLTIAEAPAYGIVGNPVSLRYIVTDSGDAAGSGGDGGGGGDRAIVRFRINGEAAGERTVATGEPQTATLTLDRAGPTAIEIEVDAAPGEISTLNNRAAVTVNGVRDRLRVLLVSGQPHPGERAWRNLLKSDPSVDLVHFTILRPPDKEELTPLRELSLIVFPVQELFERRLYDFDLVVFDRFVVRGVLAPEYLTRVAEYLRDGGAILLATGPEFAGPQSLFNTDLGPVMPAAPTGTIVEQAFRPTLSELGHRHPVTSGLPGERVSGDDAGTQLDRGGVPTWGRWFRLIETQPRTGSVLLEGPGGRPLLIVDRVGDGRIAQLASDQIWLWGRGYDGGGPQGELSRRLLHWLMMEPELEEERLSATFADGMLHIERHTLATEPLQAAVTSPTGDRRTVVLEPGPDGIARAEIDAEEAGLYRIEDPALATWAAAGTVDPPELADLRATSERLAPAIAASRGGIAWLADGVPQFRRVEAGQASAGNGWMGLRRNHAFTVTGASELPLMPTMLTLAAILGTLAAAWWREGR